MSHSMNLQLNFPYHKKNVGARKISRLKLQDEFACRGWTTCSSPFQIKSNESECDIISSPTKYPPPKKCSENDSKKKPMLAEISNIESVFLQKKKKSPQLKDVGKISETFYDFVTKVTNTEEKLNVIFSRKRSQNTFVSSQNKKHCNELSKNQNSGNFSISDSNFIKENSHEKAESFKNANIDKRLDSFIHIKSNNSCKDKSTDFRKVPTGKFINLDTSLKVPNKSLPSLLVEKTNHKKVFRTEHMNNNKNLNSNKVSNNEIFNSFLHPKVSHCESSISHNVTNFISDSNYIDKSNCSKKVNLNNSKNMLNTLKNDIITVGSASVISDSPVLIQDESSSELSEDQHLQINFETDVNKKEIFSRVHRKNSICSESLKLQDLQESFHVTKHEKPLMASDSPIKFVTDDSPVKEKNNKQDVSLSIASKFRVFSESFANSTVDVKYVNEIFASDEQIQNDISPVNVEPETALFTSKTDKIDSYVQEHEVSVAKSLVVDNKTFLKAIQSNFQEKSFSSGKGSNWVQTLNWDQFSQSKSVETECDDQISKKTFKKIIPGGFAEQMLKLQRRESSDTVIWGHKMNELKKKTTVSVITFIVTSVLHIGQITMTKSTTTDINDENFKDFFCNEDIKDSYLSQEDIKDSYLSQEDILHGRKPNGVSPPKSNTFIVLFKKGMFAKMQLEVGDEFSLYPPWQFLSVPSLPFPVILCTYFVELTNKAKESVQNEFHEVQCFPVLYKSLQIKICDCDEPVLSKDYLCNSSDLYGKSACISARVQRVWQTAIIDKRLKDILKVHDHSFSLLLQTQDGIFLELKLNSSQLPKAYCEFLSDAEGKCFRFCNVAITYRYDLIKYYPLKSLIKTIQNHSNEVLSAEQHFCYQLKTTSFNKIPNDVPAENFPLYYDYDIQSLSFLQKNNQRDVRFSCLGKIIFQTEDDFYITDESLMCCKVKKYYLLKFENILKVQKESLVGTTILVKEALIDEGYIFVDKFSSYEILSSSEANKLLEVHKSRMKKIGLITYEHILSPLSLSSKVKELVIVKGIISQVDENSAVSCLECSFCFGENLLEDSNSVIYCEDCACIVPKPVLKVKMEVVVQDTSLSFAQMRIQLLSSTVKKILKINEDDYQPECNISDVLKKNVGVLCCYLKNIEMRNELKVFHLTEINSC